MLSDVLIVGLLLFDLGFYNQQILATVYAIDLGGIAKKRQIVTQGIKSSSIEAGMDSQPRIVLAEQPLMRKQGVFFAVGVYRLVYVTNALVEQFVESSLKVGLIVKKRGAINLVYFFVIAQLSVALGQEEEQTE